MSLSEPPHPLVLSAGGQEPACRARCRALRDAGFDVIEAATGSQALELAAARRPSLVVLDTALICPDAFEVCGRLKRDPRTGAIPVLHLSAAGRPEQDLARSLEQRADACLREPLEPATLGAAARAIDELVGQAK